MEENKIDLKKIFLDLQNQMITKLTTNRECISHPETKGSASELNWIEMLNSYLPERYQVEKGFIIDSRGCISNQIDIIIFDRQYSPLLFNQNGAFFIPAESVYAVFEVKQDLNKTSIEYAGKKAGSVRCLYRTSSPIHYAGGTYLPKPLFDILAGILTLDCTWKSLENNVIPILKELSSPEKIHFGCSLQTGSFNAEYSEDTIEIKYSHKNESLIFFFLHLLEKLQKLGTVPALNITEYAKSLSNKEI